MPRVPDAYVDSVVYLYPSAEDARTGNDVGACGFTVRVPLDARIGAYQPAQLYVVTNRHVIDHRHLCVRMNLMGGGFDVIETDAEDWVPHPLGHDVAACTIMFQRRDWRFVAIPDSDFLTTSTAAEWQIGPGDDVFMVSRFLWQEGRSQNRPILHTGVVSRLPLQEEGVFNPHTRLYEPSFLVETHSRPGYSGSPVYGYIGPFQPQLGNPVTTYTGPGTITRDVSPRTFVIGVAWGYLPAKERLKNVEGECLPAVVTMSSGIAAVVPAWHIREVLEEETLVTHRRELERSIREQYPEAPREEKGAIPMDSPGEDEFQRFEDLARRIIRVPKVDLDQKRKDES